VLVLHIACAHVLEELACHFDIVLEYDIVASLDELIALGYMFRRKKSSTLEPVCLVTILVRCAAVGVSASPQRDVDLLRIRFDQR